MYKKVKLNIKVEKCVLEKVKYDKDEQTAGK